MTGPTKTMGHLTGTTGLDKSGFRRDLQELKREAQESQLTVQIRTRSDGTRQIATDLKAVQAEIEKLSAQGTKASNQQTAAAKALTQQYKAAGEAQVQESRATAAASSARTAQIREQAAQLTLTTRLASKQRQDEKDATRQTLGGIETQVKAYRDLWQARVLSNDQVYAQQARLRQQALELSLTVDKQSEAYRRLTAVAAAASRTMDQSQGKNTPGSLGNMIFQGATNALGQFGVTGDLISGIIELLGAKRAAANRAASDLGRDTVAGLVQGVKAHQGQATQAADAVGDSVAEAIRASLDIHSPSRVTEYLGRMAGLGFVTGVKSYQTEAAAAARMLGTAAEGGLRSSNTTSGAGFGGAAAANLNAGNLAASATALSVLNQQLAAAQSAGEGAAEGSEAAGSAVEGLGESVTGTAEQVKGLRDAHREEEEASRAAAVNEARTALAFTVSAATITAVALALSVSYNAAADYEKAMSNAAATTSATAEEMAKLDEIAKSPALEDLGINATQAAGGIEELGSQGLDTAKIVSGGLVNSLTLAKAVSTDVATAAAVAASATKAFGLDAKDLTKVVDVTTNAVNGTSIKINNFTDSIAAGGAVAKSQGRNFIEFTTAISLMTDKAIGASDAGTSLKSFMMALTPNTKEAAKSMHDVGFSAFDAQGNFKSLAQVSGELREIFSKMTPEQRAVTAELWFGADGVRAYNILVEAGNEGFQERSDLLNKDGAGLQAATDKMKGARGEQEKFNAALTNFKIAGGEAFLPAATQMLEWAKDFLQNLTGINIEMKKLGEGKAAYGAESYDLPSWLKQSGLKQADLTPTELKRVQEVLGRMQYTASQGAQNAQGYRNIGWNGMADNEDRSTAQAIGRLGVILTELQKQISIRQAGNNPLMGRIGPAASAGGEISGLAAVGFMGLAGRSRGTPYGQTYGPGGSWGTHNGEDWFAPTGTEVKAAFTGYVTTRWSTTTGHILEMTDAKGQKILLGHLDRYAAGLDQAIKAAGGRLLVQQGQLLAYVGQTGSLAHKDLGPRNAHVHVMGYDARGRVVDPMSQSYSPVSMGGQVTVPIVAPTVAVPTRRQTDAALIAEAKRILTRVEALTKAGDLTGKLKAEGVLDAFEKGGPRAAGALEVARLQLSALNKETSKYGQGYDKLDTQLKTAAATFKVSDDAQAYIKSLDGVAAAAGRAAAAEKKRWGETDKYRALLGLQGDAADKARSQREALQRDQDHDDKEAETRNANRLKSQQAFNTALAAGNVADAQRSLNSLKDRQQEELDLYKNDAAARVQVIERTGPAILAASDKLINLQRDQKVKAAQAAADKALGEDGADPVAIEQTRQLAVTQAFRDATAERAKVRREQQAAERTADDAADKAAEQVRTNRLAADRALADGQTDLARKRAQAVVTGYDDALKAAGDSAQGQLAVEERLGRDLLAARDLLSTTEAQAEKTRLERERNTAINVTGLTLAQRQDLWRQYNARISQVDTDLQATLVRNGQASAAALDAAWSKVFSADDAERAKAYGEMVQGLLARLPDEDDEGLIRIYSEAQGRRDLQVMNAVFGEWETRREAEAAGIRTLMGDAAEATTQFVLDTANDLIAKGDLRGALKVLQGGIGDVQAQALAGAPATAALERLYTALNNLADAGKRLSGDAAALAFWQAASDAARLIPEDLDGPVAALRPRPAKVDPYAPLPQAAADLNLQRAAALRTRLSTLGDVGDDVRTETDAEGNTVAVVKVRVEDDEELNRTLMEAANLLNSDLGKSLPESVRQGLEEAVAGAQAYKEALASITGEAVADGASEALKNAPTPGTSMFAEKAGQIFKMQGDGDLADPVKVQALRQALDILRQSGNLTDVELGNLNATIDQFTSSDFGTVELGKRFDLGQWQKDIQELGEQFDSGEIDAKTFTDRLALAGDRLREYAKEADAAGNPKLAQAFRDQADSLRAMNPQIAGVIQRIGKMVEYLGYVQQLGGAMGQLAGALGEGEEDYDRVTGQKLQTPWKDVAANIKGAVDLAGKLMDIAGDVMKVVANPADVGAWISLITKVVSSIADAIAGFSKARAEAQRLRDDFQEANPLVKASDYQTVSLRSRGFFGDLFKGPEVVNEIDKIGLPVAQSLASSITQGITSGFQAYQNSGNLEDFSKTLTEELSKGIKQAMVDGFLNDPQRQNEYAAAIKAFTDAYKTGDPTQIAQAAQILYAQAQQTAAAAKILAEQMDELDKLNGTGRYSPEAIAERARALAAQALGVEEQQLELQHTKGLLSTAEYEGQKLTLALRRIEQERAQALAAAGLTAEQIALINEQYDLQGAQAQADADAARRTRAEQLAKDLSGLQMNNAETALGIEEKLATSLATTEEEKYQVQRTYAARRLALTLDRLAVEEAAEKALVDLSLEGAQAMIDAISEKYRLARESAGTEVTLLERSYAAQQEAARQSALNTFTNQWASTGATAFMAGLEKTDFSTFLNQWRGNLTQATIQAIAEAEIGRVVTAQLLPLAERYRLALGTAGTADDLAALADLRNGVTTAATGLQPFFEGLQPLWADLKNELAENTAATKDNTEATKQQQFYGTTVDASTYPPPTRSAALQGRLTR